MYCERCGAEVKDTDKFCEKCGNIISSPGTDKAEKNENRTFSVENEENIKTNTKKKKRTWMVAGIGVVILILFICLCIPTGKKDGRTPDENYPTITNVSASSEAFKFNVDRAWATGTILCPKEEQKDYGSEYLAPQDDNAIFYIVEFTFTNTSNDTIDERPIIRFVDSYGIEYNREEELSLYTKRGGTSPDYSVYDEGVELSQPMAPGLSIKGQCTFIIAKDRLNENCSITCSMPQISANDAVEWLTGFNFGVEETVSISLKSLPNNHTEESKFAAKANDATNHTNEYTKPKESAPTELQTEATTDYSPVETETKTREQNQGMIPESSSRLLTDADVAEMTDGDLRIAINEIYARHGRRFNDMALQDWFDSQTWYQGTIEPDDFKESVLSQIEKDNIVFLQKKKDSAPTGNSQNTQKALSGMYEAHFGDEGGAELEITFVAGDGIYAVIFSGSYYDQAGYTEGNLVAYTDGTDNIWEYYEDNSYDPSMRLEYDGVDTIEVISLDNQKFGGSGFPGFSGAYQRIEEYPMP